MTIRCLALAFVLAPLPVLAAEKKPTVSTGQGQWLKIPDSFMVHRFVQSSKAEPLKYRVCLVVPPGGGTPRVTQSSGRTEVDAVAFDYARETAARAKALREMNRTKELVFQLLVAPPVLDNSFRTAEGAKPVPAGKEFYTPIPLSVSTRGFSYPVNGFHGQISVRFPAAGGRPLDVWMSQSTGEPGVNLYFLKYAVANWQTTRTADQPFVTRIPVAIVRQNFGGRLTTH